MAAESDGVAEAMAGAGRVALTLAARLAEIQARRREEEIRRAQARAEEQARELQARLDAERAAARASLEPVHQREWWDQARIDDVTRAWETAQTWRQEDPEIDRAADRIVDEVRDRWRIDLSRQDADTTAAMDALGVAEQARQAAGQLRGGSREEQDEALALMAMADRADREAEANRQLIELHEAAQRGDITEEQRRAEAARINADLMPAYDRARHEADVAAASGERQWDSAERRQRLAASLEGHQVEHEVIEARIRADIAQALPASEAVQTPNSTRARVNRARSRDSRSRDVSARQR